MNKLQTPSVIGGKIEGKAVPFGEPIRNYFPPTKRPERILYHARSFKQSLQIDDVFLTVNHDAFEVANTKDATMNLTAKPDGLYLTAWPYKNAAGYRGLMNFWSGELRGLSICTLPTKYERTPSGFYRVTECQLYEISLVTGCEPAAKGTWARWISPAAIEAEERSKSAAARNAIRDFA